MSKIKGITYDPLLRVWVLLLFDAAERAGITPMSKLRVHRLVYFSNCLADLYRQSPLSKKIIKYKRGPFYPDLQWNLDRLVMQGLMEISDIKYDEDDEWWLSATYTLSDKGNRDIEEFSEISSISDLKQFLIELAFSFAAVEDKLADEIALKDATYDAPARAMGALIDFSYERDNYSTRTAKAFSEIGLGVTGQSTRDQIHFYMRYLEMKAQELAAG